MKNQNNSLSQKSFSKSAISPAPKTKKKLSQNVNPNLKPSKLINNSSNSNNTGNRLELFGSFFLICLFVSLIIINYLILKSIGFEPDGVLDIIELVVMVLVGAISGIGYFINEFENREGYILRFLISLILGFIGDLFGLGAAFIICLIIYLIVAFVGWFFG